tara:strand:- start:110 stop:463 length:354 start_codon:yes stop_codon:yes gene_type:complete
MLTDVSDAVALAKLYIKIGEDKSADNMIDKIKKIIPAKEKSLMGSFSHLCTAQLYLEKNDYQKVEKCVLGVEKLIQEHGLKMLEPEKEKILGELCEKQNNYKQALKHYHVSIKLPPT